MTLPEQNKIAGSRTEDWAVFPFDEKEDEARWTKLIEETEELEKEASQLEAVLGELLMENSLSEIIQIGKPLEDTPF